MLAARCWEGYNLLKIYHKILLVILLHRPNVRVLSPNSGFYKSMFRMLLAFFFAYLIIFRMSETNCSWCESLIVPPQKCGEIIRLVTSTLHIYPFLQHCTVHHPEIILRLGGASCLAHGPGLDLWNIKNKCYHGACMLISLALERISQQVIANHLLQDLLHWTWLESNR